MDSRQVFVFSHDQAEQTHQIKNIDELAIGKSELELRNSDFLTTEEFKKIFNTPSIKKVTLQNVNINQAANIKKTISEECGIEELVINYCQQSPLVDNSEIDQYIRDAADAIIVRDTTLKRCTATYSQDHVEIMSFTWDAETRSSHLDISHLREFTPPFPVTHPLMDQLILAMREYLHDITRISCQKSPVTGNGVSILAECRGLQDINLSATQINDGVVYFLAQNPTLRSLNISNNPYITSRSLEFLKSSPLTFLDVSGIKGLNVPNVDVGLFLFGNNLGRNALYTSSALLHQFYRLTPCDQLVIQNPHLNVLIINPEALSPIGKKSLAKRQSETVASSIAATLKIHQDTLKKVAEKSKKGIAQEIDTEFLKDSIYPLMDHVADFLIGEQSKTIPTSTSSIQNSLSTQAMFSRTSNQEQKTSAKNHSKSSRMASFAQRVEETVLSPATVTEPSIAQQPTTSVFTATSQQFWSSLLLFMPMCLSNTESGAENINRREFKHS